MLSSIIPDLSNWITFPVGLVLVIGGLVVSGFIGGGNDFLLPDVN